MKRSELVDYLNTLPDIEVHVVYEGIGGPVQKEHMTVRKFEGVVCIEIDAESCAFNA